MGADSGAVWPTAILAGGAAVLAGCFQPYAQVGAPCGPDEPCPSNQWCSSGTCIEGEPEPDACAVVCEGDVLVGCADAQPCEYGCTAAADGARCRRLAPSNGLDLAWLDGATATLDDDNLELDTGTGTIRSGSVVVRGPGPGVIAGVGFHVHDGMGVFVANRFAVPDEEQWSFQGPNTVVLFAATTIVVEGALDVGASGRIPGPGGLAGASTGAAGSPCRGGTGTAYAATVGEGGGGGGGATAGGAGAPANLTTFGVGGTACPTPSTIPLRGGNGGGAGGIDAVTGALRGGAGGGGGGAIALVAMQSILIKGDVAAPGAGGLSLLNGDGGGGGGGGGAVLVEAPSVVITGALTANGGGGGAPSAASGARGHVGDGGTAAGGVFTGKSGGRGAASAIAPTNGQTYTDGLGQARGGGGGGAAGKVEIRAVHSTVAGTAVTSPTAARLPAAMD